HIRQTEETPARRATWHRGEIVFADLAVQRVRGDAFQLGGMGSRDVAFSVWSEMGFDAHKHSRKRKMPATGDSGQRAQKFCLRHSLHRRSEHVKPDNDHGVAEALRPLLLAHSVTR